MWFIPLLVIGAIVFAAASRSPREALTRQLAPGAPPSPPAALPSPGPISVLGEFARIGQVPPPTVILCAIAEAEAQGRDDLASDIIRVFVAPVVQRHERGTCAPLQPPRHERGTCAPLQSPRHERGTCAPLQSPRHERGTCASPRSSRDANVDAPGVLPIPMRGTGSIPSTDEEIRAMLNDDPAGFIAMVTRGMATREAPIETSQRVVARSSALQMMEPPVVLPAPPMAPAPSLAPLPPVQPEISPETVAQMQESAGLHEVADQTRALAPGSPLIGVSDDAWREFVVRLGRESPLFSSSRHIGQYRQRRERLTELGIDPSDLVGSAQAQRAALDADLVDAQHHAADGGLLAEHVGRPVAIPGRDAPEVITLSGALGVIQCAGLDGAVGWLERPSDRRRYPHTTAAFLHTNGVF